MRILALNIGATGVQAAVLDVQNALPIGTVVEVPCELDRPTPETATFGPEPLWIAFTTAARQAMHDADTVANLLHLAEQM